MSRRSLPVRDYVISIGEVLNWTPVLHVDIRIHVQTMIVMKRQNKGFKIQFFIEKMKFIQF